MNFQSHQFNIKSPSPTKGTSISLILLDIFLLGFIMIKRKYVGSSNSRKNNTFMDPLGKKVEQLHLHIDNDLHQGFYNDHELN